MSNKFTLLGKGGEKNDYLIELPDRPLGIGTDPNKCSIIYSKGKNDISEFHCQLVPKQGGWTIADYSDKGTWLNGKKMTPYQAYPLKSGDVFYLANLENSFYFSAANNVTNSPQGQGQTQSPQWFPQGQGQVQSPQWSPQGQVQKENKLIALLKKYIHINGRMNRKPYLLRLLAMFLLYLVLIIINTIAGAVIDKMPEEQVSGFVFALFIVWLLFLIIVYCVLTAYSIAIAIRRIHDTDNSAWWLLAGMIPFLNFYVLYLLWFKKGTTGSNRYGSDPLA